MFPLHEWSRCGSRTYSCASHCCHAACRYVGYLLPYLTAAATGNINCLSDCQQHCHHGAQYFPGSDVYLQNSAPPDRCVQTKQMGYQQLDRRPSAYGNAPSGNVIASGCLRLMPTAARSMAAAGASAWSTNTVVTYLHRRRYRPL